jgi:hypothetical protein
VSEIIIHNVLNILFIMIMRLEVKERYQNFFNVFFDIFVFSIFTNIYINMCEIKTYLYKSSVILLLNEVM